MLTSEQMDQLIEEWRLHRVHAKTVAYDDFLKEYGEYACWEEWLAFLQERPELRGFGWARSLSDRIIFMKMCSCPLCREKNNPGKK